MIETIYFAAVAGFALIALSNWRLGLTLALITDFVRDPIRKLTDDQSVWITVAGLTVWTGVVLGLVLNESSFIKKLLSRYPSASRAVKYLILALCPGTVLSLMLYDGGYKLVGIGLASYLAPIAGIVIGFALPRNTRDIAGFARTYVMINSIGLIGTVLEYQGLKHRLLGGMDMVWIRHQHGYVVNLIAGFYRSPDVMGLHAAHVACLSICLAVNARGTRRTGWAMTSVWGIACVLLSGRRKMLGIPLVFVAMFLMFSAWRRADNRPLAQTLLAVGAILAAIYSFSQQDTVISTEYTQYASTLFTDGAARTRDLVGGSILTTLSQSGILGSGIGSATQGAGYVAVNRGKAWQEDGVSRVFKELGVPGAILIILALLSSIHAITRAVRAVPSRHPVSNWQLLLLSLIVANTASFAISHQQYSGDPSSAIIVLIMIGIVLGIPRLVTQFTPRQLNPKPYGMARLATTRLHPQRD